MSDGLNIHLFLKVARYAVQDLSTNLNPIWHVGTMFVTFANGHSLTEPGKYFQHALDHKPRALLLLSVSILTTMPAWCLGCFAFVSLGKATGYWLPALLVVSPILISSPALDLLARWNKQWMVIASLVSVSLLYWGFWIWAAWYSYSPRRARWSFEDANSNSVIDAATVEARAGGKHDSSHVLPGQSNLSPEEYARRLALVNYLFSVSSALGMTWLAGAACCKTLLDTVRYLSKKPEERSKLEQYLTIFSTILFVFLYGGLLVAHRRNATRVCWHIFCAAVAGTVSLTLLRASAADPVWQSWAIDAGLAFFTSNIGLVAGVFTQSYPAANAFYRVVVEDILGR